MTDHLTEQQFSDVFLGECDDARALAHLRACSACRAELATLHRATDDFSALCMQWAEGEAIRSIPAPSAVARRFGVQPRFAFTFGGAALALGLVAAFFVFGAPPAFHQAPTAHAVHYAEPAEVAADNQWLKAMDAELRSGPDTIVFPESEVEALQAQGLAGRRLPGQKAVAVRQ